MPEFEQLIMPGFGVPGTDWGPGGRWNQPVGIWGSSSRTTAELCQSFLNALKQEFGCLVASAWSLDPVNQLLIPVALLGHDRYELKKTVIPCPQSLSGYAADRQRITPFPELHERRPDGRYFQHPEILKD